MTYTDTRNTQPLQKPEFLRERELAARWRTSQRTLQRWRALGDGPAFIRIGGAIRYRMDDVIDYEAQMQRGGQPDCRMEDT